MDVTRGSDWRGVVLRLPSNRVARVRPVGPDTIFRLGKIPDVLTPILAALMEGKGVPEPETADDLRARAELISVVCQCAMVEPRVVSDRAPKDDSEISLDDLDWYDKEFLMSVLMASTLDLERFRDGQIEHVDAVEPEPGDEPAAESVAEVDDVDTGAQPPE
jgi:hypothetical protein